MALIQVALEVPDDVYIALLNGDLVRRGGVVRDTAGQIVLHLKEVGLQDDEASMAIAQKAAALAKQNKVVLIGIGVAAAATAVGGAIVHVVKSRKEKKLESITEVESSFNASMQTYLDSVRSGNLNEESLEEIIAQVDAIKDEMDGGSITVDFTDGQIDALVAILKDYTERLAQANNVALADLPPVSNDKKESNFVLLRYYLGEQQRILEAA